LSKIVCVEICEEDFEVLEIDLDEQDRFVTFTQPEELEQDPPRRVVFIDKIPLPPSGGITVKANAFNSTSSKNSAASTPCLAPSST
jgi:hypothetical protein